MPVYLSTREVRTRDHRTYAYYQIHCMPCPLKTSLAQSEDEFGTTSTREQENGWPCASGRAMLREESPFL